MGNRRRASGLLQLLLGRPRTYVTIATDREHSVPEPAYKNVCAFDRGSPYSCPCCGHRTLPERGQYDLCGECDWEDDGQDDHDSHIVRGGPNGPLSLDQARADYEAKGGVRNSHRPPSEPV